MNINLVALIIILLSASFFPPVGQNSTFTLQQVEISDTVLINSIIKYKINLSDKDVMIVACETHLDSVKYYISSINSSYKLFKNIPSAYTKVATKYVLLYTGLEHIVKISNIEKRQFLEKFGNILAKDILPDGTTRDPKSFGLYDPIEVLIIVKNGKKVYEDFKKGFGAAGMPYITNN